MMDSNTKDVKVAREFIVITMVAVLFSIIIMLKILSLLELYRVSYKEQDGMKTILNVLD